MTDTEALARRCREAYSSVSGMRGVPWERLSPAVRAAWVAVAQAKLEEGK